MRMILLFAAMAMAFFCVPLMAQQTNDSSPELTALVIKIQTDLQAGKHTEADLSDDLKQFDVLLAKHKGEKTDAVARILYMKILLYSQVIGDATKADALMNQLTNDFSGTQFVAKLEEMQAKVAAAQKIQAGLAVGSQFPDFNAQDVNGKPLSIANYKGKVVMIDFWATWCGPCRGEIPNVVATYKKYHDKGFEIIGVSLDSDKQKLLDFTAQNEMTWQQYFDGQGWENKLAAKYGVQAIPMTFLLDGSGKIIGKNLRGQELTDMVAGAVAGP